MATPTRSITLGVVLFPNWEPLDVMGPVEIFSSPPNIEIAFIAAAKSNVPASRGSVEQPANVTFGDILSGSVPPPTWLLVPGGIGTRAAVKDTALLAFLKDVCPRAELCMTVCTGTALLAAAGVLDGRQATSNKKAFEWVASNSERVRWVRQARWVQDGPFMTSSGVSAGMDMAVRVLRDVLGAQKAAEVAAHIEYLPATDAADDPFADPAFLPAVE